MGDDSSTREQRYSPGLDALRGVAILLVLCNHWLPRRHLVNRLMCDVPWGVYVFFVLSGFLITRILIDARGKIETGRSDLNQTLTAFYIRRCLRLLPLYYTMLLIGLIANFPTIRSTIGWHATFVSNFYFFRNGGFDRGPAAPFWTLSVEEQFYAVWPALVLLLPRRRVIPAMIVAGTAGLVFGSIASARGSWAVLLMPSCVPFLTAGGILAVVNSNRTARIYSWVTGIALPLAVVAAVTLPNGLVRTTVVTALGAISIATGTALLIRRIVNSNGRSVIDWIATKTPIGWVGRISYGLFVLQFFVSNTLDKYAPAGAAGWAMKIFAVRFAVTSMLAWMSWRWFERPINNLKRWFPYSKPKIAPDERTEDSNRRLAA